MKAAGVGSTPGQGRVMGFTDALVNACTDSLVHVSVLRVNYALK